MNAHKWLIEALQARSGTADATDIRTAAADAGISLRTLQRAAKRAGVTITRKPERAAGTTWTLHPAWCQHLATHAEATQISLARLEQLEEPPGETRQSHRI